MEAEKEENGETEQQELEQEQQPKQMSKKAMKRALKWERMKEKRMHMKAENKEKRKLKRKILKEEGNTEALRKFRPSLMADSSCKIRVCVEMAFDGLMSQKDQRSCIKQVNWSYAMNRRSAAPLQFYVVNFRGESRQIYDKLHNNQDIHLDERDLDEVFNNDEIIYLSSESDNVLNELDESKVYVIGGLVDHNSQKGLCHMRAENKGWAHARLPIDEFVQMKTRKVLTVNHVFEILLRYTENKNWEEAFFSVIPKRKGAEKKESLENEEVDEEKEKDGGDVHDDIGNKDCDGLTS